MTIAEKQGERGCGNARRSSGPSQRGADERMRIGPEGSIWQSRSKPFVTYLEGGLANLLENPDIIREEERIIFCKVSFCPQIETLFLARVRAV